MATSQNGWPTDPPRRSRLVPGTGDVRVTVADGPAGDVLIHVLAQVHARVESLELDSTRGELDDWGYAARPIRGGTTTSNHASATAVDGNATRHPLGVRGTFTARQAGEIREILAEVDNVVRWGGDYTGRPDEMHFEINAGQAAVTRVAARLSTQEGFMSALSPQEQRALYNRGLGFLQQRWYVKGPDGSPRQVAGGTPGAIPAAALDTLDGAYIVGQIAGIAELVRQLATGEPVDLEAIATASEAGTRRALEDGTVHVDVTVGGPAALAGEVK